MLLTFHLHSICDWGLAFTDVSAESERSLMRWKSGGFQVERESKKERESEGVKTQKERESFFD